MVGEGVSFILYTLLSHLRFFPREMRFGFFFPLRGKPAATEKRYPASLQISDLGGISAEFCQDNALPLSWDL